MQRTLLGGTQPLLNSGVVLFCGSRDGDRVGEAEIGIEMGTAEHVDSSNHELFSSIVQSKTA